MKVYVTTMSKAFMPEEFINVYSTKKKAEKALRSEFPNMRKSDGDTFISDARGTLILFIHEKEVE